jgi:isopropylmalate/homocitrate/citramalate synthase
MSDAMTGLKLRIARQLERLKVEVIEARPG